MLFILGAKNRQPQGKTGILLGGKMGMKIGLDDGSVDIYHSYDSFGKNPYLKYGLLVVCLS
jgi:hypothetical protein